MLDKGFVMMIRCNGYQGQYAKFTSLMMDAIPESESLLIYSMWSGYIDPGRHQKSEYIELLAKFSHVERIHTSGHASMKCLTEVCNASQPRMGIIPIHSEDSANYMNLDIAEELKTKIITSSSELDSISIIVKQSN